MLIKSPKERQERAERNRKMLWAFLNIHIYSNLETLAHHIGAKTKPVVSRILKKWMLEGLIKKVQVKNKFGRCWLFGITTKALEGDTTRTAFQPSKVNLRTLDHTLKCQRASSYFLKHEALTKRSYQLVNIETGDLKKYGMTHRPDLIIQKKDEKLIGLVCIEVELSLKSKQRYDEILKTYIHLIQSSQVNQVIYIFYDEQVQSKFEKNILSPFFIKHTVDQKIRSKVFVNGFK